MKEPTREELPGGVLSMPPRLCLDAAIVVAALGAIAATVWFGLIRPPATPPPRALLTPIESQSLSGAHVRGSPSARVAVIEYADFECPYCGVFAATVLPTIVRSYVDTGRVLFAFEDLPLPNHKLAPDAARGAECAGRQGLFWAMHDRLFLNQRELAQTRLSSVAASIGADQSLFEKCLSSLGKEVTQNTVHRAAVLGIHGTPTFFVGTLERDGRVKVTDVVVGSKSVAEFSMLLDSVLKAVPSTDLSSASVSPDANAKR